MKLKTTDKIVVEITHQQEKALEDVFAYLYDEMAKRGYATGKEDPDELLMQRIFDYLWALKDEDEPLATADECEFFVKKLK
jgi:hypothetical protein